MRKRFLLLLILVSILSLYLLSCDKEEPPREYVESEVLENATRLIDEAYLVNRLVWGVGLPPSQAEDAKSTGIYVECDKIEAEILNIHSVEDIRTLCQGVYSSALCKSIDETVFQSLKDENENFISPVRYYDYTETTGEGENETKVSYLMVNTEAKVYFEYDVIYHMGSLNIENVKGQILYLSVGVTVYDDDGGEHARTLKFSMIEEENGWRLASPTYMKYDPYADIYDELVGK